MARIRRLAAVAGTLSLASAFVAGPASAQQATAESFVGSAAGRALNIQLLGQGLTVGVSSSKVTSQLTAVAEGVGALGLSQTVARAELAGAGQVTKPDACAVPVNLGVLNVGLACGNASATVAGSNPSAKSTGKVAGVELNLQDVLGLAGLNQTVQGLTNQTLDTVKGTVGGLLGGVLTPVVETVDTTVENLLKTQTLTATIGESVSDVTTDAGNVVASARASGAEIKVLPLREIAGVKVDPLATITVSSAAAKAVYNRSTGTSTPSFDPSLVTIKLGTGIIGGGTEIKVPIGVSQTILAGTPLESDIIVAAGRNVTNPDGTVGAIADGVKLHLLKGLNGGLLLELAHAEAGVGGTPAAAAPAIPNVELPRTGATPWIPLAGVSILGLAVLVRRVLVRAY